MIKGIGIDLIELDRIADLLERQPRFVERILTEREMEKFAGLKGKRRIEFAAGRFAAKEAYSKARGTGIGEALSFLDIEISNDPAGKPYIARPAVDIVHLSITHSRDCAAAQVVIEEEDKA